MCFKIGSYSNNTPKDTSNLPSNNHWVHLSTGEIENEQLATHFTSIGLNLLQYAYTTWKYIKINEVHKVTRKETPKYSEKWK